MVFIIIILSRHLLNSSQSHPFLGNPDSQDKLPQHVAIIMDGNNRWAKQHGLEKGEGHRAGEKSLRATVEHAARIGIPYMTVFAFSSENWQRPKDEVELLMHLFIDALDNKADELNENNIQMRFIGDMEGFSKEIQIKAKKAEALTQNNTRMILNVALNYGGQWDIANAAKNIAHDVTAGVIAVDDIDESLFNQYAVLSDQPPVDLCIRTAGEQRISNFLLWQIAYAELFFSHVYWPDFDANALDEALIHFTQRERRFGKTSEQVQSC